MYRLATVILSVVCGAVCLLPGNSTGEPVLSLGSLTAGQGETLGLSLSLSNNTESIGGINAKIVLPDGVTCTGVSPGPLAPGDFVPTYEPHPAGQNDAVTVFGYSSTTPITAASGVLLTLTLSVSPTVPVGTCGLAFAASNLIATINTNHALSNANGTASLEHSTSNGAITIVDNTPPTVTLASTAPDPTNVSPIHNLEEMGEDWAIDMAYADGGSLADAAASGALTVQDALLLVRDVLDALATCHEAGVVHRDVKPNNILISSDGRALLSDFGLAALLAEYHDQSMASASSSGLFVGTPRYAPPESWNEHDPTPAWDVYSIGMVIFELVAGKTPYDASSPFALMRQMIEHPAPRLADIAPTVSPELSDLVGAMLDQDPAKRPQNAREALQRLEQVPEMDLDAAREASTVVRQRVRVKARMSSALRRKRRSWRVRLSSWAVAVGFVAALVVSSALLWNQNRSGPLVGQSAEVVAPVQGANSSQAHVFTSIDTSTHQIRANHLLMIPGKKPNEWVLLGAEGSHLWYLQGIVENEVSWAFRGYWGEYADDTARYFQHGQVTGKGRWIEPGHEMTASLDFYTADLGTRWSQTLMLKQSETAMSEVGFVRELQKGDYFLALLYNELFARNLPWAEDIETQFLALVAQRTTVPFLGTDSLSIRIDGRLDESVWQVTGTNSTLEPGLLMGKSKDLPGRLLLRWNNEALFIGMETLKPVVTPQVVVAFLRDYAIPVAKSDRWLVRIGANGVMTSRHTHRGLQEAWRCVWEVAVRSDNGWHAEIRIPFKDLDMEMPSQEGSRWRLNTALYDLNASEDAPLTVWGTDDLNAVEQGAILAFARK